MLSSYLKNQKQFVLYYCPVEIVPESMMIHDVLNNLIKKRKSIAIVLDEYGGTSGMITVEDIVEELFGEIEDEHDSQEFLEEQINETQFPFFCKVRELIT